MTKLQAHARAGRLFGVALTLRLFAACGDSDTDQARVGRDAGPDSGSDAGAAGDASTDQDAGDGNGGSAGSSPDADADLDAAPDDGAADAADQESGNDGAADAADGDGGTTCAEYPLRFTPDPGAEALARSALEQFSPGATLTWRPALGTIDFVSGMDVELPGCVAGADVFEQLWPVVESQPVLFQLDRSEWGTDSPIDCATVTDQENLTVRIYRTKLGSFDIARDVFAFSLRRVGGTVRLRSAFGTYVAQGSVVLAGLTPCATLPLSDLTPRVLAETYDFVTYFQCNRTGEGTYVPSDVDQVSFEDPARITWYEESFTGPVLLTLERAGRLVVDPANYTDELLASDANCPAPFPNPGRVVGFHILIDAVTGEVLSKLPGIDCIVC
jgi:hypothetical protein